jgi:hypothetical protein
LICTVHDYLKKIGGMVSVFSFVLDRMIADKEHKKQAIGKGAYAKARGQGKGGWKMRFYCTENAEACCHEPLLF